MYKKSPGNEGWRLAQRRHCNWLFVCTRIAGDRSPGPGWQANGGEVAVFTACVCVGWGWQFLETAMAVLSLYGIFPFFPGLFLRKLPSIGWRSCGSEVVRWQNVPGKHQPAKNTVLFCFFSLFLTEKPTADRTITKTVTKTKLSNPAVDQVAIKPGGTAAEKIGPGGDQNRLAGGRIRAAAANVDHSVGGHRGFGSAGERRRGGGPGRGRWRPGPRQTTRTVWGRQRRRCDGGGHGGDGYEGQQQPA